MIDSTNPRVMADNIKDLYAGNLKNAEDIALGRTLSNEEFDTGKRYGDKVIYGRFYTGIMPEITSESTYTNSIINLSDIDKIFTLSGVGYFGGYIGQMPYINDTGKQYKVYYNTTYSRIMVAANGIIYSEAKYSIYIEYTKAAPTPDVSPAPDDTRSIEPEVREEDPEAEPIKKTTRKKTTTTE